MNVDILDLSTSRFRRLVVDWSVVNIYLDMTSYEMSLDVSAWQTS
jgi:hypothetical protein